MGTSGGGVQGTLHRYTSHLVAFEHTNLSSPSVAPQNTILFISGLSDGLLTVPYTTQIASQLPPSWSITEVLISASYTGWGTSSLSRDAREIGHCVAYFRRRRPSPHAKIVLMGHSTGCQDVMKYLTSPSERPPPRPPVDGAILQAPVSDREGMVEVLPAGAYDKSVAVARSMLEAGEGEEIMPSKVTTGFFGAPCTARRWLSLASPNHDGDDDYFSSDLDDDQLRSTFGRLEQGAPLCILYSGKDEFVPDVVDKESLIRRWIDLVKAGGGGQEPGAVVDEENSGVVPGATHSLIKDPPEVLEDLVGRVVRFVRRLDAGDLETVVK